MDQYEVIQKLNRDMSKAARLIGRREVRFILDLYYQFQDFRKANASQIASLETGEPNMVMQWCFDTNKMIENNVKKAMDEFSSEYRVGNWLKSLTAIGPVISAGLLARLDIRKANFAGAFFRYCGLDPTKKWEKGQKCPWNMSLKRLCWIIGDLFWKFQNHESDYYGKLMVERKEIESRNNENRVFADQAVMALATKKFKNKEVIACYKSGMLPKGHIQNRVIRWVVTRFMSHVHSVMYWDYYGTAPPVPYMFTDRAKKRFGDGHTHFIPIPNWPFEGEGKPLTDLLKRN